MQKIFNTLIDSFIENKIGIAEHFLTKSHSLNLKNNLKALYSESKMLSAGTGNSSVIAHNKLIRNDKIYWLDRIHNDPWENSFFNIMDRFVSYLNDTCYTGITGYEFHYTLYEKGSFYKKHLDQFKNNESRKYSIIIYLNTGWKENDGGELCIHEAGKTKNISPNSGKIVFFKSSELEHEVLITNKSRLSITGWLKVDQRNATS